MDDQTDQPDEQKDLDTNIPQEPTPAVPEPEKTEPEASSQGQNKTPALSSPPEDASSPATETETPPTSGQAATPPVPPEARWFVLHTYSGHENKVAAAIKQRAEAMNIANRVFEVIVPTRDVVTVKRGKKEEVKEKYLPGYLLVHMVLDDDSWLIVRTTPGVTAFVGTGNRPTPLSEKEVEAIMKFSQLTAPKFRATFSQGEAIKIIDGPFTDFLGSVESIDEAHGKVKVLVSIFGRETPVELDFLQVSKLQ